jgi:hypothetical protein
MLEERRLKDSEFQNRLFKDQRIMRNERLHNTLDPIISDLKEDNLLNDGDTFSFELDNDRLIVNGKKQSAELHSRYKEKYIKNPGNQYKYSQKGNRKSSTIVEN